MDNNPVYDELLFEQIIYNCNKYKNEKSRVNCLKKYIELNK